MTQVKKKRIDEKKERFLEVLNQSAGFISAACEAANISRRTYYRWYDKDEKFRQSCKDVEESNIDYAESKLLQQIKDGNTTATIFFLKTKGKNRGYVERQEVTGKDGADIIMPKITKKDIDELKRLNGLD